MGALKSKLKSGWRKKMGSLKRLSNYLPIPMRDFLIRRGLNLNYSLPSNFKIEVVQSVQDMEAAFRILHDSYVEFGFMKPHASGMRILPQHLLHTTTIVVAKLGDEVIGTISLIRDNPLGLPMDTIFDLSFLRESQMRLCETSSFAVKKEHRGDQGIYMLPLSKYAINYSQDFGLNDQMVISVNPSMCDFYRAVLLFKMIPAPMVEEYGFVSGAPAVGEYLSLSEVKEEYDQMYKDSPEARDLSKYMKINSLKNLNFPERVYTKGFDSILNAKIMKEFFGTQTGYFTSLPMETKNKLLQFYSGHPIADALIEMEPSLRAKNNRQWFRFATKCPVRYSQNGEIGGQGDAIEVSAGGLLLRTKTPIPDADHFILHLATGPGQTAKVSGEKVWSKGNVTAIKIVAHCEGWGRYLRHLAPSEEIQHYQGHREV